MNDLVSVIIPNYNYAHYVCDAVDSVLRQDYDKIEIIVVDDGSTDNSVEILKKYGSQIKLIQSRNSELQLRAMWALLIRQEVISPT